MVVVAGVGEMNLSGRLITVGGEVCGKREARGDSDEGRRDSSSNSSEVTRWVGTKSTCDRSAAEWNAQIRCLK